SYSESFAPEYSGLTRAAHLMLHSRLPERQVFGTPSQHAVLMGLRFDGCLGFIGGLIDADDASVEAGLAREIREEIGAELAPTKEHFLCAHVNLDSGIVLYFYTMSVPQELFCSIEKAAAAWHDHGHETLGCVRVPCYRLASNPMLGIVAFMRHNFVGNARQQLAAGLVRAEAFTAEEMRQILLDAEH
ncbi:hypothetical protein BOX15_Mlig022281g1, partial [Macrostomum lignano]